MSRLVGIVPARAGSEGIPGKCSRPLAGSPLVNWTLVPALDACDLVILTTNDPQVLALGWCDERLKVQQRPDMLATPRTPDLPVVRFAYNYVDQEPDDVIVLLRPTAPFRRAEEIREVAQELVESGADSVRSILPAPCHPSKMYVETGRRISTRHYEESWLLLEPAARNHRPNHPRQWLPSAYRACGFIDCVRADVLAGCESLEGDVIVGWPAPPERAVDLDNPEDWEHAEQLALERSWRPGHIA